MQSGQVKINLLFDANTSLARKNIQELGGLLQQISNTKVGIDSGPLAMAAKSAQDLQIHLQNALNIDTGKLDLGKLSTSLSSAKTSLSQLTSNLVAAGPAGQQAFVKIAMAIQNAEAPAMRLSQKTKELIGTLGNTVKWQLASSAIHGVTGAIKESIGYIEKFDKALTDIRMVSDINNTQMLEFVENTKKIAKEVNATSLEIAQGATIFFQQGLSAGEVEKRIAVTQKMANVTRESTETVASQLTSIWNNFATGSEDLEKFADKIAYLGATTAADTNQIATAMQKFSAAAKTVGLSYDYAASMVAEVVDRTQMSAEVVGTAFNSILSRIQNLNLGETLDDGVTLNKYTEALKTVGVNVLDMNGKLKSADTILSELGAKWVTLDAAQQKALATTVAGVRQQTQFIALMEEWKDVEKTVSNLGQSTDYLNKRNEEYANSIEGIKKQLEEAKNTLFDKLLNADGMKTFYKVLTQMVNVVTDIVDNFGGLMPMVLTVAALFSKQLFPMLINGTRNLFANVMNVFGFTERKTKKLKEEFNQEIQLKINSGQLDRVTVEQLKLSQELDKTKQRLLEKTKYMGQAEKELVQNQIQIYEAQTQMLQAQMEEQRILESKAKTQQKILQDKAEEYLISKKTREDTAQTIVDKNKDSGKEISKEEVDTRVEKASKLAGEQSKYDLITRKQELIGYTDDSGVEHQGIMSQAENKVSDAAKEVKASQKKLNMAAANETAALDRATAPGLSGEEEATAQAAYEAAKKQREDAEKLLSTKKETLETAKKELKERREELQVTKDAITFHEKKNDAIKKVNPLTDALGEKKTVDLFSTGKEDDTSMDTLKQSLSGTSAFSKKNKEGESTGEFNDGLVKTNGDDAAMEVQTTVQGYTELLQVKGQLQSQEQLTATAVKETEIAQEELKGTSEAVAKAEYQQVLKLKDLEKQMSKVDRSTKAGRKQYQALMKDYNKIEKSMSKYGKTMNKMVKSYSKLAKAQLGNVQGGKKVKALMKDLSEADGDASKSIKVLTDAFTDLKNGASGSLKDVDALIEGMKGDLKNLGPEDLEELERALVDLGYSAEEAKRKVGQLTDEMDKNDGPDTFGSKLSKVGSTITGFLGAVSMGVTGIQTLASAFDEGNTPMETFMGILSGLMMTIPAVTQMTELFTKSKLKDKLASMGQAIADEMRAQAAIKAAAAEGIDMAATNASIPVKIAAKIANLGLAAAKAIKSAISTMGWPGVAVGIAAAAAIMAGMAFAASAASSGGEDADADEDAAAGAQAAAESLAKAYEDAKASYDEFMGTMDGYKSAREGLEDLTKGTLEYKEALAEANQKAMELIKNNPELFSPEDYYWEDGELIIKEEALEEAQQAELDKVQQAQAASLMADAAAQRAQAKADASALKKDIRKENGLGGGATFFKALGAGVVGSLAGPMGAAAATGAVLNSTSEQSAAYNDAVNKALEAFQSDQTLFTDRTHLEEEMAKLGVTNEELIDALWENQESITELGNEMNAAEQAWDLAATNAANALMSDSGFENSEAGQMALEAGGRIYSQLYDNAYEDRLAEIKDRGAFGTGTDISKATMEEYAKLSGLADDENYKVTNYKANGDVVVKYTDENGDTQEKTISAEEIATTLATADADAGLQEKMEKLKGTIADLNASGDAGDKALANFIASGNVEGATKAEFDDLRADAGITGEKDANGNLIYDETKVNEALGLTGNVMLDNIKAMEMGYSSAEEYRKAFVEAMDVEWEVPPGVSEGLADSLTLGASKKIQENYEMMGEEGGKAYIDTINSIASGADWEALTPEDQQAMMDEISNVDMTAWDAGDQMAAIADKYGVAVDTASAAWDENIKKMRDAADAIPDLTALSQQIEQINEIASDIEMGSIISKEDYDTLIAYNRGLEDYFTILSDGSAKFTGDLLDFQQEVKETNKKKLEDAIQGYQDRVNEMQAQYDAGNAAVNGNVDAYAKSQDFVGEDGNHYYYGDDVQSQIDFLRTQGYNEDTLKEWEKDLADGSTYTDVLERIGNAVKETAGNFNALPGEIEAAQALIQGAMNEIALGAETAAERLELLKEGTINAEAYGAAMEAAINTEAWEDLDVEEVSGYAQYLEESFGIAEEGAEEVARAVTKMNKGIEELNSNWEEWGDILKTGNQAGHENSKMSAEYVKALNGTKKALSDVLDVSEEFISTDFVTSAENLELIEKAAEGDADAIDKLGQSLARNIAEQALNKIEITDSFSLAEKDEKLAEITSLMDEIDALMQLPDLNLGDSLTGSDELFQKMQQVVEASKMTAEQANAYYRSMGFTPHFKMVEAKQAEKVPITTTHHKLENIRIEDDQMVEWTENEYSETREVPGGEITTALPTMTMETADGQMPKVPSTEIESVTYTGGASLNNYSSTNSGGKSLGGGGDSSPAEKVERTKKSDVVNRYEEIEDKLDDIRDAADRASKAMDRLYGADRIQAMRDQNKYLKEEVDALKDKRKEAEQYLKEDTEALAKAATEAGVRLEFDDMGNVTNYTEQMTRLYDQLAKAEAKKDSLSTKEAQDDYQETHVQPIQDAIDKLKEEYGIYEDSREAIEDLDKEIQDAIYAWQDSNAELLNYEIELQVEMDERELQKIEYYLSKMEDDFYSTAESAALIGDKIALTNKALQDNENNIATLKEKYEAGEISQSAYVEGLKNEESKMYANLQTLQELDDTMMHYYGETLSKAQEELSKYTEKMDHQTSVLDHYRTLLDLTGQSQNFKAIGTVLEGQVKTIENSYQVAKQNYEWLADEAVKKKQAMNDAIARGDTEAAELFKQEWEDAEASMREAQDNMLSQAEAWAEKLKEVLENKLADLSSILEDALTGGRSFDELSMQMEHAQGIQEEYLTTTNKIYETNKMIRNAQNEIDKTTNTVAKQKLKAFQQETQQLQNQGQLSQFELDIQQKKYDLLLAEIALEEAQNAKSVVTLQRDSEGNFGYVYTADQNQVSGAEQGVEDAENALYNTRLEGANNYASQRQELLQGLYDSLTNLDNQYYIEGTISEEEYNRQKEAIQSYYFERLAQNSELYAIATEEDATISQEAWSTSLGIMDKDASDLVEAVDDYLSNSKTAFNEYQIGINDVAKKTGTDLDTLASNVKDITDESDKLKKKVKDEVIPELQNELDKVSDVTGEYALHRDELALVMKSYEDLLTDIGNVITEMGKLAGKCDSVKTKAQQAASAVGSIGDIGTYSSSGSGSGSGSSSSYGDTTSPTSSTPQYKITHVMSTSKSESFSVKDGAQKRQQGNETYIVGTLVSSGEAYYINTKTLASKTYGRWNSQQTYSLDKNTALYKYKSFDTGGYTGEWGSEGKLALLHQKELVLNAHQTEDLLMTMELLDSIIKQIDMMTMNNKISQMNAAMNEAVNAIYREQMAQEVHIEANFPNATDRNEIYQALEMLANDTSQFINR